MVGDDVWEYQSSEYQEAPSYPKLTLVYEIQRLLMQHRPDGFNPPEFPILTKDGVRSPDLVWITSERRRQTIADSAASIAPEI